MQLETAIQLHLLHTVEHEAFYIDLCVDCALFFYYNERYPHWWQWTRCCRTKLWSGCALKLSLCKAYAHDMTHAPEIGTKNWLHFLAPVFGTDFSYHVRLEWIFLAAKINRA